MLGMILAAIQCKIKSPVYITGDFSLISREFGNFFEAIKAVRMLVFYSLRAEKMSPLQNRDFISLIMPTHSVL